jgi:hypothetical protein
MRAGGGVECSDRFQPLGKFQTPTSNIQKSSKLQIPKPKPSHRATSLPSPPLLGIWNLNFLWMLDVGIWSFSGFWMLVFGIFRREICVARHRRFDRVRQRDDRGGRRALRIWKLRRSGLFIERVPQTPLLNSVVE